VISAYPTHIMPLVQTVNPQQRAYYSKNMLQNARLSSVF